MGAGTFSCDLKASSPTSEVGGTDKSWGQLSHLPQTLINGDSWERVFTAHAASRQMSNGNILFRAFLKKAHGNQGPQILQVPVAAEGQCGWVEVPSCCSSWGATRCCLTLEVTLEMSAPFSSL